MEARKTAEEAIPMFTDVEYAQKMLLTVDNSHGQTSLQLDETARIKSELVQLISELMQSVNVSLSTTENCFGTSTQVLCNRLKALMSKDCTFPEDASQVDYIITIKATCRKASEKPAVNMIYGFVDVSLQIKDVGKQKIIYTDSFPVSGGGGPTLYAAGKEMLERNTSEKVWEVIEKYIK